MSANKKPTKDRAYTPFAKCKFLKQSDMRNASEHKQIIKSLNDFHEKFENTFNKIPLNGTGKTIEFQTAMHMVMEATKSKRKTHELIIKFADWKKNTKVGHFFETKLGKLFGYAIIGLTIIAYLHMLGIIGSPIQFITSAIEWYFKLKKG